MLKKEKRKELQNTKNKKNEGKLKMFRIKWLPL